MKKKSFLTFYKYTIQYDITLPDGTTIHKYDSGEVVVKDNEFTEVKVTAIIPLNKKVDLNKIKVSKNWKFKTPIKDKK